MKLKIFSDRNFLPTGMAPTSILYPFWSDLHSGEIYSWISPYNRYVEVGQSFFEMVPLEAADIAILPMDWRSIRGDSWRGSSDKNAEQLAIQFAELVHQAGKPLVVFFGSECSDESIPIKDAIVLRQSVYQSLPQFANSPIFPFFCEDFVKEFLENQLPIRQKGQKPTVGFRGFARPLSLDRRVKTLVYHGMMLSKEGRLGASPYKGESLRVKALNILSNHPEIESKIKIFDRAVFFDAADPDQKRNTRMEYVQNLTDSDYTFCCRGSGNYSNRFYEVLSCGRIPIFLDTDCKLPLDTLIDWKKYCVWVDEKDLSYIGEKVLDFHNSLSPQEFVDLQYACRELWLHWLSPEGFYSNLHLYLQNLKKQLVYDVAR